MSSQVWLDLPFDILEIDKLIHSGSTENMVAIPDPLQGEVEILHQLDEIGKGKFSWFPWASRSRSLRLFIVLPDGEADMDWIDYPIS